MLMPTTDAFPPGPPQPPARRARLLVAVAAVGLLTIGAAAALEGCVAEPAAVPAATRPATLPTPTPSSARSESPLPAPASDAPTSDAPASEAATRAPHVTSTPTTTAGRQPAGEPAPGAVLDALAGLSVKGRSPKTGYERDLFGVGWQDPDHNSCTTRQDILRRDLRATTVFADSDGCAIASGVLADPYTGRTIAFRSGATTSDDVQIDHIVALSDAWQKGAQQWSPSVRVSFANDPLELLATDGPTNEAKGDSDAASWLPPDKSYRCTFVARQISIKARYALWVTAAEQAAMARVLHACPDQALVSRGDVTPPQSSSRTTARAPQPPRSPTSDPPPVAPGASSSTHYANCAAVRDAGAAPISAGDPGYSRRLDRDGDGVGCE